MSFFFLLILFSCPCYGQEKESFISDTFTMLDFNKLQKVKLEINSRSDRFLPAYQKLMADAKNALDAKPTSVVEKSRTAASGDKHDYLSLAPYWWPDLDKEDGLPWIRKDGEVNPMTRGENVDTDAKNHLFYHVKTLSLAFFFSGEKQYADKTKELLQVWFIDETTKMNPNLDYAQGIPGRNTGRGFGIIDFHGILNIVTALEILKSGNALEPSVETPMRKWLEDYLNWLQTSKFGIFEKTRKNNHGTLYDVQLVCLLLFLDKTDAARTVLESVTENRIRHQIEADGRQPHELDRTKGMTYSILNLSGLTKLAFLGRKERIQIDLWKDESASGTLKKGHDFLYPYVGNDKTWPYQQLGSMDKAVERLQKMFAATGSMLNIPSYCGEEKALIKKDDVQHLLYPCFL
ncbi:alginate lyase family protein [Maribacter chungangensis]|uniref:alginate lyase family protein n=1 Tax=Maribacter chungangensis TaxID=1069117 RepID=UPI0036D41BEC